MPNNKSEKSLAVKGQLRNRHKKDNFFGETLREFRRLRDMTQEEAANNLQVSQAQWCSYELGSSRPSLDVILLIADMFKVHPLVLIGKSLEKFWFPKQPGEQLSFQDYEQISEDHIEKVRAARYRSKLQT